MLVADAYRIYNDCVVWSVRVNRNLNDWKMQEFEELFMLLEKQNVKEGSDQVSWKLEKKGTFSIHSYYRMLIGGDGDDSWDFPF